MKELVFNIADIFNSKTTGGCLSQYEATSFHIPAYQRGYKWATGPNGAVTVLLNDLWHAFEKQEDEYYLQYITVKPLLLADRSNYLEVIDGQQRLTTLSILLSVLNLLQADSTNADNIACNKLDYAIRANFFDEFIYAQEKLAEVIDTNWDEFIAEDIERLDRQDIYYLYGAVKECANFFVDKPKLLHDFKGYLFKHVKLIVNSVEQHIVSETVFKNLNSNKVPLSEVELIKALFITRVGRDKVKRSDSHFREVMEVRLGLSRTWEDIQQWAQSNAITSFYFDDKGSSLHELLKLTALVMGAKQTELVGSQLGNHSLFNFFSQQQSTQNGFEYLISTQERLKDWFDTDEIYHLIGFCRFAKNSEYKRLSFLKECLELPTKTELTSFLRKKKSELLFGKNAESDDKEALVKNLKYGDDDKQIHAVLLALSVFPKNVIRRFDFDSFKRQEWSLEHIFPQTPEGKGHVLTDDEKQNIKHILASDGEESEAIELLLKQASRTTDEQKVYVDAIRKNGTLDNIGNMCLLTGGANSALGCLFFDGKRQKILELIQRGNFVPKHTFDVFAKMIAGLDVDLKQWSKKDIDAHAQYVASTILNDIKDDA
ncbi:DUF262 domain-containing protein [Shewanella sp. 10N.286.48.B5]|uniref:DUF262 domain-containing protein n=1 Tax=Shewanella sp. 10N.286.48.B5 TaxID=1880834 RepID=UPI000C8201BB|nr:DUF262 domain-containing protein [Shewanella sp. 10N.286.48.B5]PMH85658.1 hypothetical protein BCU57_13625 [Shewanella sp. 10N.286.48.B5]